MSDIQITTVIFDMDGLMLDTERLRYEKMRETTPLFGYEMSEELLYRTVGVNRKRAIEEFRRFFGEDFPAEEVFAKRGEAVERHIELNGVPVKKGLFELLDFLSDRSVTAIVATSSCRKEAAALLSKAAVLDRIDDMVCGDDIARSKPDPEIFLAALKKSRALAERALVLEDSRLGILAASRAGIRSVMVPDLFLPDASGKKLCHRQMSDLLQVRDYLARKNLILD